MQHALMQLMRSEVFEPTEAIRFDDLGISSTEISTFRMNFQAFRENLEAALDKAEESLDQGTEIDLDRRSFKACVCSFFWT
jgi:hypothetical protein